MRRPSFCRPYWGWPITEATSSSAGEQGARRLVHLPVETGQDDRAHRQAGDGRDQLRGRRDRAGGTGHHDRPLRRIALQAAGFGEDAAVAVLAGIERVALGEDIRPFAAHDLEKGARDLPPVRQFRRIEIGQRRNGNLSGRKLVHQRGEIAREPEGVGHGDRREDRLAAIELADVDLEMPGPLPDQRAEQQQPLGRLDGGRNVDRCCIVAIEELRVFVEFAKRPDLREQDRFAA